MNESTAHERDVDADRGAWWVPMFYPSNADYILAMVNAYSPNDLACLTGYVVLARSIDTAGKLRRHRLIPGDQSPALTAAILREGALRVD